MKRHPVLILLLLIFLPVTAEASSLFGRVIEINDGDVITVFNLNRPVRVKLLAVDAPEAGQAFGDAAKKHLSDLVYDKSVLVEYWGIAPDGSLVGRVTLNGADVGAQMIRDGAAWFDPSNQGRLSATDREVYRQSEELARNERRGLWQAENPVAPWEFVRSETLRLSPVAKLNSILPATKARVDRPTPELTNLSLIAVRAPARAQAPPAAVPNEADYAWALPNAEPKTWRQFKPAGENFSALVPEDGKQLTIPVPFEEQMVDVNVYMARDGSSMYSLMWITGPSYGESDKAAIDSTVQGFLSGVGEGYSRGGSEKFSCEPQGERNVPLGGFSGSEFDLGSCTVPGRIRAFTRVRDGERQMYIGAVFYAEEEPNVMRFLKSFIVVAPKKHAGAKRSR